jgi:hypothetical protein
LTLEERQVGPMEVERKPRLEFSGAIYHVLSRADYRKKLFDVGSARLFGRLASYAKATAAKGVNGSEMRETLLCRTGTPGITPEIRLGEYAPKGRTQKHDLPVVR